MKLLFVIDNLGSGGAQRQIVVLARGLKARGHECDFFTYYSHSHYRPLLEEFDIPVHQKIKTNRFSISPLISLYQLINQQHYDVAISFLDTPNLYSEIACISQSKTKVLVSERSVYPQGGLPAKLRILQEFHRFADAITVNSQHQREKMEQQFPWMTSKIQTIYNGVDLELFTPPLQKNRPTNNVLSLIAISTIVANKNMLNLVKALKICRDFYNIKPLIAWAGKQDLSEGGCKAFADINYYVKCNQLENQWEWLGERTDIPGLLQKYDALIHPSLYEGLPNVVCEALSSGLPVLVSDVCDHPLLVEEGVTGFLFNPHSPERMAESIYKFHKTTIKQRQNMELSAREFAVKNISMDKYIDTYENVLQNIMKNT
jgi:glycosyltransferase involved in cell wall biosynthesis